MLAGQARRLMLFARDVRSALPVDYADMRGQIIHLIAQVSRHQFGRSRF